MAGEERDLARAYKPNRIRSVITHRSLRGINSVAQRTNTCNICIVTLGVCLVVTSWIVWSDIVYAAPLMLPFLLGILSPRDGDVNAASYTRVSTRNQSKDGGGLESQIENCKKMVKRYGYNLVYEFVDDDKSGTEFNRNGLDDLLNAVRNESIDVLVVDDLDRIGRTAPQTLSLIHILNHEYDVVIRCPLGVIDTRTTLGLILATALVLISDIENRNRARRVQRGRIDGFSKKNWKSFYHTIPLGYELIENPSEDDVAPEWIRISDAEAEIVRDVFEYFTSSEETKSYQDVITRLKNKHGLDFYTQKVKKLLTNPVYVGNPTASVKMSYGEVMSEIVRDDELKIVDEAVFSAAKSRVEQIAQENQKLRKQNVMTLERIVDQYGIELVLEVLDNLQFVCPDENCVGRMVRNGYKKLNESSISTDDTMVPNMKCNHCGKQKKMLTPSKLFKLRGF